MYNAQMANLFTEIYNWLPLCHLINRRVLVSLFMFLHVLLYLLFLLECLTFLRIGCWLVVWQFVSFSMLCRTVVCSCGLFVYLFICLCMTVM